MAKRRIDNPHYKNGQTTAYMNGAKQVAHGSRRYWRERMEATRSITDKTRKNYR